MCSLIIKLITSDSYSDSPYLSSRYILHEYTLCDYKNVLELSIENLEAEHKRRIDKIKRESAETSFSFRLVYGDFKLKCLNYYNKL